MRKKALILFVMIALYSLCMAIEPTGNSTIDSFFKGVEDADKQLSQIKDKTLRLQSYFVMSLTQPTQLIAQTAGQDINDAMNTSKAMMQSLNNLQFEISKENYSTIKASVANNTINNEALMKILPESYNKASIKSIQFEDNADFNKILAQEITDDSKKQITLATQNILFTISPETTKLIKDDSNFKFGEKTIQLITDIATIEKDIKELQNTVKELVDNAKKIPAEAKSLSPMKAPGIIKNTNASVSQLQNMVSSVEQILSAIPPTLQLANATISNEPTDVKITVLKNYSNSSVNSSIGEKNNIPKNGFDINIKTGIQTGMSPDYYDVSKQNVINVCFSFNSISNKSSFDLEFGYGKLEDKSFNNYEAGVNKTSAYTLSTYFGFSRKFWFGRNIIHTNVMGGLDCFVKDYENAYNYNYNSCVTSIGAKLGCNYLFMLTKHFKLSTGIDYKYGFTPVRKDIFYDGYHDAYTYSEIKENYEGFSLGGVMITAGL